MRCSCCTKEFGNGSTCQNCGVDRVTGLGQYDGYTPKSGQYNNGTSGLTEDKKDVNIEFQQTVVCHQCSEIIPADSKYCPVCGNLLAEACPKCGHIYSTQYPYCPQCGTNKKDYLRRIQEERELQERKEQDRRSRELQEQREREEQERREREEEERREREREKQDEQNKRAQRISKRIEAPVCLTYKMNTGANATKVVAFGSGACNMVNYMHENKTDVDYYIFNDFRPHKAPNHVAGYVNYNNQASPVLTASNISENWDKIMSPMLEGGKRIVAVACLGSSGGKIMAGLMERLCQECVSKEMSVSVFVTLPFSFEGMRRMECALDCLDKMNPYLQDFKMVKNDEMRNHPEFSSSEAFDWVSGQLLEFVG